MMRKNGFKKKHSIRAKRRKRQLWRRTGLAIAGVVLLAVLIYAGSRDRAAVETVNDPAELPQEETQQQEIQQETDTEPDGESETTVDAEPEPTGNPVVVIDAGHGGKDQGCAYSSILEKDINLNLALLLREELEGEGIETVMIREDDTFVYLNRRVAAAENVKADVYVSIHVDAYPGDPSIHGITIHYQEGASGGKALAGDLYDALEQSGITKIRDIMASDLYVLRNTSMPAVLVEVGFLTNAADRENLQSESFSNDLVQYLSDGILQYLEQKTQA